MFPSAALRLSAAPSIARLPRLHFINDFAAMLGVTPGEYAARHGS
jgi:hypothetical protein